MRWIDTIRGEAIAPVIAAQLARQGLARQPDNPRLRLALARSAATLRDMAGAVEQFEWLAAHDPGFDAAGELAECYIALDRFEDALRVCDRSITGGTDSAMIRLQKGEALTRLDRRDAARAEFEACVALGDYDRRGLRALLRPLARLEDGAPLLEACDALPAALAANALVRANRAIAYSRLGRVEEARAMIDLDRHVVRVPIDPPPAFATIEDFNAALAEESLAASARRGEQRDTDIVYSPHGIVRPLLSALLPAIRAAMEAYVARIPELGLTSAFPTIPQQARLFYGCTILTDGGANGQHIHDHGDISCVYHVQVPDEIAEATDGRGALTLGGCELYTGGHQAVWGTRLLRPRPGWLTLFPSHVFHDVIPTRSSVPRISIAADLVRAGA
ncbi:MAG: putative 2OG-Fe(II) oxygenase [Sphingomonas sp.]